MNRTNNHSMFTQLVLTKQAAAILHQPHQGTSDYKQQHRPQAAYYQTEDDRTYQNL